MKQQLYVLKRTNGFCGLYLNGKEDKHLVSNFSLTDSAGFMFNRVMMEIRYKKNCEIIFTENEEEFVNDKPSLEEWLKG